MRQLPAVSLLVPLLTACPLDPQNIGDPGADESASIFTDGGFTEAATVDEPTAATEPEVTDTDTDTDTDTGGDLCPALDPATSAEFLVLPDAWPNDNFPNFDFTHDCTIDEVSTDGTTVTTVLTCDVDGVPRGLTFTIAAAPEGDVDWAPGLAVTLFARHFEDDSPYDVRLRMTLVGDPDALLVHASHVWGDSVPGFEQIGPIAREITDECEFVLPPDRIDIYYQLTYVLADGPSVSVWSRNRASLAIDAGHAFVIDLDHSNNIDVHGSEHSLVRRVKL